MDTPWRRMWTVWKSLFSRVGSTGPVGAAPGGSLQECTWTAAQTSFQETKCFSWLGMIKALSDLRQGSRGQWEPMCEIKWLVWSTSYMF